MKRTKGPKFLRFALPVLDSLRALGGSGKPAEVTDAVIESLAIPEEEQQETTKNGNSRVKNQIAWARFYLAKGGLIDPSERGIWRLTKQGETAKLSVDDVYEMFKSVQGEMHIKVAGHEDADAIIDDLEHETDLLNVLRSLSPEGFERICQLLLRKSGFEKVEVTGRSGDGGIDGHGLLELNPFVSFKVLFQCKRYTDRPVSASHVRDFRGAMMGRADKGIILTTGQFTSDAQKEARRDGVPPIEMVNGEKLVSMFEHLQLGVRPKTVFEIDSKFFDEYR
ncbi:restriction endonuclease [Thiocapsa imhoffii]|uniref:Restriction endonuclease n=1 Tax=Thiocapsa imhoffii TaxID=382777 RepID=A0A9X0WGD9_9GAMM|nr:restriction endonuclease [Thiocapsa imhoffii]MBK1644068.1 restriction endonuclease [Thiocapsa imhoffii]